MSAKILQFGEEPTTSQFLVNDRGEIVNEKGEVLMSHADVIAINLKIITIKAMQEPKDVPALKATGNLKAISQNAVGELLEKCKTDLDGWDPIRTTMTKLASRLHGFCADSITALDELVAISGELSNFETLPQRRRDEIRGDMQGIFSELQAQAEKNEKDAANLAASLGKFSALIGSDKISTDNLRTRYSDYIEGEQLRIRNFELSKGMKPTDDLLADLQTKIVEFQAEIAELEKNWIITTSVAGGSVALLSNPVTFLFGLAGCIGSGAAAGVFKDKWNQKLAELQPFIDELNRAERMISLQSWFNSNQTFFKELSEALADVTTHLNNLRGAWQEIANELEILVGDTGKLNSLKAAADDWQRPISNFKTKTTKAVYTRIQDLASYFQKVAYLDRGNKAA